MVKKVGLDESYGEEADEDDEFTEYEVRIDVMQQENLYFEDDLTDIDLSSIPVNV